MKPKHPPGPLMILGNMRAQGVRNLIGYCLNNACRHSALIDVSGYPDHIEIPTWRAKCSKCGSKHVDVRPNWKEKPGMPDNWKARPAWGANLAQRGRGSMRLSLGAFLLIGLLVGIASAATAETKLPLPPPVSLGTPVKFKRNVVACHSLDVRLEHFFDRGDPQELSSHHCTNIPEGELTTVEKFSKAHGVYCMSVPGWKDCGWILEEPLADEIVVTPPPADIPNPDRR